MNPLFCGGCPEGGSRSTAGPNEEIEGGGGGAKRTQMTTNTMEEPTNSSRPYDTPERRSSIRIRGQSVVNDMRNVK